MAPAWLAIFYVSRKNITIPLMINYLLVMQSIQVWSSFCLVFRGSLSHIRGQEASECSHVLLERYPTKDKRASKPLQTEQLLVQPQTKSTTLKRNFKSHNKIPVNIPHELLHVGIHEQCMSRVVIWGFEFKILVCKNNLQ